MMDAVREAHEARRFDWLKPASALAVIGFIAGLYLALAYAPSDTLQGDVQRVFYLHLAAFAGAFVGFISAVIGGVAYLRTRQIKWDVLAYAGVEVGMVLAIINVITGVIYARPITNSWWTWDPKLTAVLIMTLTYAAYLMLRGGVENPDTRRLFASVYGIVAFVTVIYTFVVIRLRTDTLHAAIFGPGSTDFAMPPPMETALLVNVLVWAGMVAPALMGWRIRLERYLLENERRRLRAMQGEAA